MLLRSPQGCGGCLPEGRTVGSGKAAKLRKPVAARHLCRAGRGWANGAQGDVRQPQAPQAQIPAGADPQEFGAAQSQGAFGHVKGGAELRHRHLQSRTRRHGSFKTVHDLLMASPAAEVALGLGGEATDQGFDQVMLHTADDLRFQNELRLVLGEARGSRV